jgi:NAD(P)-dependent dehydrogenase (short-subunit alcohol dehydrogenase family)
MPGTLDGRVALVTGAGRGIGREIAIGLAASGARVALLARTETQLDEVAEAIQRAGGTAIKLPADLSDPQAWRTAVDETERLLGRVEILINNAAEFHP